MPFGLLLPSPGIFSPLLVEMLYIFQGSAQTSKEDFLLLSAPKPLSHGDKPLLGEAMAQAGLGSDSGAFSDL